MAVQTHSALPSRKPKAADTFGIGKAPATIRDFILETVTQDNLLGEGNLASVYRFSDPAFDDFVLRVSKLPSGTTLEKAMTKRTALSPPHLLLAEPMLGQSLLVNNTRHDSPMLGIHLRVDGKSLKQWRGDLPDSCKRMEYFLNQIPDSANPFLAPFIDIYRIAISGYTPDMNHGNIMFDPKNGSLQLIDQLKFGKQPPHTHQESMDFIRNAGESWLAGLTKPAPQFANAEHTAHYNALVSRVKALVEDAEKAVENAATISDEKLHPLCFARVENVKGITLNNSPKSLLESLRKITSSPEFPTR